MRNGKFLFIVALAIALPTSQTMASALIATDRVVSTMSAERDRVAAVLQRDEVQQKLVTFGVTPAEATQRLASLSDAEVSKIAGQLDNLKAGGDGIYLGVGALIIIALVVILLRR